MTEKRKGARSTKDIPQDILDQLNQGEIETVNLTEWLAVDQKKLLENVLKQNNRVDYLKGISEHVNGLKKQTVNTINEAIGTEIFDLVLKNQDEEFLSIISKHSSDLVRCWATYTIGKDPHITIGEKLERIKVFAADQHFGVREISWMAVRSSLSENLKESLLIFTEWTKNKDENIRRFASESTRPRGVWTKPIEELKQNPEWGLKILEPLRSDSSKYVQNSVGNWLNDAGKSQPEFVTKTCDQWLRENPTKETQYIVKRALRTILK